MWSSCWRMVLFVIKREPAMLLMLEFQQRHNLDAALMPAVWRCCHRSRRGWFHTGQRGRGKGILQKEAQASCKPVAVCTHSKKNCRRSAAATVRTERDTAQAGGSHPLHLEEGVAMGWGRGLTEALLLGPSTTGPLCAFPCFSMLQVAMSTHQQQELWKGPRIELGCITAPRAANVEQFLYDQL